MYASEKGHKEVVELLIERGAEIDKTEEYGATSLMIASGKGHKEVVELLIERGAAIDKAFESGATSLYIACQEGHKEVVELLIERGADKNHRDNLGIFGLFRKRAIDYAQNDEIIK